MHKLAQDKFSRRLAMWLGVLALTLAFPIQAQTHHFRFLGGIASTFSELKESRLVSRYVAPAFNAFADTVTKGTSMLGNLVYWHPYISTLVIASIPATCFLISEYGENKTSKFASECGKRLSIYGYSYRVLKKFLHPTAYQSCQEEEDDLIESASLSESGTRDLLDIMVTNSIDLVRFLKSEQVKDIDAFLINQIAEKVDSSLVDEEDELSNSSYESRDSDCDTDTEFENVLSRRANYLTLDSNRVETLLNNLSIYKDRMPRIKNIINDITKVQGCNTGLTQRSNVLFAILSQYAPVGRDVYSSELVSYILPLILEMVEAAEARGLLQNNKDGKKFILDVLKEI